jgi:hypothetical protein
MSVRAARNVAVPAAVNQQVVSHLVDSMGRGGDHLAHAHRNS